MHQAISLMITPNAASELARQAAFAGTPGCMHLDLLDDSCGEGWLHIRLKPGKNNGVAVARADGITLFAPSKQLDLLNGLRLSYFGDLSGGGFLVSTSQSSESCACGAGFRLIPGSKHSN